MDLPQGPVAVFWDMENCAIPCDIRPEDVAINIRTALGVHPVSSSSVTTLSAYGDFSSFSRSVREGCQKTGVKLIDVPNGRKDAADKAILVDMFLFALDNHPPSSIMLISGDVDFSQALHILGQRGHTIILAIPSGVKVSPALCNAGQFVLEWPSVARGEGFVSPARPLMATPIVGPNEIFRSGMKCQISGNRDTPKEKPFMHPRMSQSHYHKDFSLTSEFLSSNTRGSSMVLPCFSSAEFNSGSLPFSLNEVQPNPSSNQGDASCWWLQSGDLNGLKGRLVKLLELSGGSLALAQIPSNYQELFDQPLCVSEHGTCKLVNLLQKFSDVMPIEGKGAAQFVYLRNFLVSAANSKPQLLSALNEDKKWKEVQNKNKFASSVSGSTDLQSDDHNVILEQNPIERKEEEKIYVSTDGALGEASGVKPISCTIPTSVSKVFSPATSTSEYDAFRLEDVLLKFLDMSTKNKNGEGKTIRSVNVKSHLASGSSVESPDDKRVVSKDNSTKEGQLKTMLQVKKQLVMLLEQSGGCVTLAQIIREYQKFFNQPLHVSEYGASELANLLKELSDEITFEGEGENEFIHLNKFQDGTTIGTAQLVPSLNNCEKGEGIQNGNEDTHLVFGLSDELASNNKRVVGEGTQHGNEDAHLVSGPCDKLSDSKRVVVGGESKDFQNGNEVVQLVQVSRPSDQLSNDKVVDVEGERKDFQNRNEVVHLVQVSRPSDKLSNDKEVDVEGERKGIPDGNEVTQLVSGPSDVLSDDKKVVVEGERKENQLRNEDAYLVSGPFDKLSDGKREVVEENKIEEKPIFQLKWQLVKLLEQHGGFLALNRVHSEYQKLFGRYLCPSEYGTRKLKNLWPKLSDVMSLEGEVGYKFVYLKNFEAGTVANCAAVLSPSLSEDKKGNGEGIQNANENAHLLSDYNMTHFQKISVNNERKEKVILLFKRQVVMLLERFGGCLAITQFSVGYQHLFGRPLRVSEYGACKLENLLLKFSDVVSIEGVGHKMLVYLKNYRAGSTEGTPLLSTSPSKDKNGILVC